MISPGLSWSLVTFQDMHLKACRRRFEQREATKPAAERCPLLEEEDGASPRDAADVLLFLGGLLNILNNVRPPR